MKNKYLLVTIFLIALVVIGGYLVFKIPSQNSSDSANIDTASVSANINMNDQLEIQDEVVGTGVEAVSGKSVTVNYSGTLTDGTKFDSSYDRNEPFTFKLGAGEVIAGWDQGFAGMKVGGKRKLTIPPSLGYGSQDMGTIPPNSTLIFEVELLKVE
jgi:FKBP-type peptidyl-prolyl cis-trans isomerase